MANLYSEPLPGLPQVPSTNVDDLRASLAFSLRTPRLSVEAIRSPMDIRSINWNAVDTAELLAAIGAAYESDRQRLKMARALSRYEDRAIESHINRGPKEAKRSRKRIQRGNRMAASGLFKQVAQMLGMNRKNLY